MEKVNVEYILYFYSRETFIFWKTSTFSWLNPQINVRSVESIVAPLTNVMDDDLADQVYIHTTWAASLHPSDVSSPGTHLSLLRLDITEAICGRAYIYANRLQRRLSRLRLEPRHHPREADWRPSLSVAGRFIGLLRRRWNTMGRLVRQAQTSYICIYIYLIYIYARVYTLA